MKTQLYASIRIVKATCKLHAISQIESGAFFLDTHKWSDIVVPVSNLRIGKEVKGNTTGKVTNGHRSESMKGKQRFSIFICDWKEDHEWIRISAFQRKNKMSYLDSFDSENSDDKVLIVSDKPIRHETAEYIWDTILNYNYPEKDIFTLKQIENLRQPLPTDA